MATTQIIHKGGGWYYPADGDPEDDVFQISKKDLAKSKKYEVVEAPEEEDAEVFRDIGISPSSGPEASDEMVSLGDQESWGPYNDYQFVTTPYGEYGVPAGKVLARFEPAVTSTGKRYMKPIYTGKFKTRSNEEIAKLRDKRAERDRMLD